ncbi:uncharacterized protein LOC117928295 [Vitis riparia]|uniref:uncharacterized protein LOC117928295 n=1 Tax=Vitis riparia TaxID=96939 RepID=UPI00155A8BDF|nr:uncharacterized protein LOC117928295 [Vitis riparia]
MTHNCDCGHSQHKGIEQFDNTAGGRSRTSPAIFILINMNLTPYKAKPKTIHNLLPSAIEKLIGDHQLSTNDLLGYYQLAVFPAIVRSAPKTPKKISPAFGVIVLGNFRIRVVQESSMDGNEKEGEISIVNIGGGSVFVLYQNIGVLLVSSR